jgi:hypothetical protein
MWRGAAWRSAGVVPCITRKIEPVASLVLLRLTTSCGPPDITFMPLDKLVHLSSKDTPFGNMPFSATDATLSRIVPRWKTFSLLWALLV